MQSKTTYWLSKIKASHPTRSNKMVLRYNIHRLVWLAFQHVPQKTQPFLFQITPDGDSEGFYVLVQSLIRPRWNAVTTEPTSNNDLELQEVVGVKCLNITFSSNDRLAFRLFAAPIKNEYKPNSLRGKKKYIVDRPAIAHWFENKCVKHGITISRYEFTSEIIKIRTNKDFYPNHFEICVSQFDGILQITNPNLFQDLFEKGFGAKKAFGFGMLAIALP